MTEQAARQLKLSHRPTPIAPRVAATEGTPLRLAVYGEGGVGKTSLALTFPKPLVIDTDGGLEGDAVARTDLEGEEWMPENWGDLNGLYFWLKAKVKDEGYRTIVIDSIDTLARFLLHEATDIATKVRPENASTSSLVTPEQQDYGKVANAIDIFLGNLKKLQKATGVHLVITSAVREPDPDQGRTKRTFDVQRAVEACVIYWASVYGELEVVVTKDKTTKIEEEHRVLWTRAGDPIRKCKSRYAALRPGVKDPTYEKLMSALAQTPKENA